MSKYRFPPEVGPLETSWIDPLFAVERSLRGRSDIAGAEHYDPRDFMVMCRVVRQSPRPDLFIYRHQWTRRYLNADADGQLYRYYPPKRPDLRRSGQYRRFPSLHDAIWSTGLWKLPVLRPNITELEPLTSTSSRRPSAAGPALVLDFPTFESAPVDDDVA